MTQVYSIVLRLLSLEWLVAKREYVSKSHNAYRLAKQPPMLTHGRNNCTVLSVEVSVSLFHRITAFCFGKTAPILYNDAWRAGRFHGLCRES
jgi:hypothetical protein